MNKIKNFSNYTVDSEHKIYDSDGKFIIGSNVGNVRLRNDNNKLVLISGKKLYEKAFPSNHKNTNKMAKKSTKTTGKAPVTTKKAPAPKKPGVIATILIAIKAKKKSSIDDILKHLTKAFPERDPDSMVKTIKVQLGKKQPMRIEKEKGVKITVSEGKDGERLFSL